MNRKHHIEQGELDESQDLKNRLAETEETLQAIRQYMVDAFVINRDNGIQVVTLHEAEIPYRMMVEAMNEGAVTLIPDGTIFYCNSRFGEMLGIDCEKMIGTSFQDLIVQEDVERFKDCLRQAQVAGRREEFRLLTAQQDQMPLQLSMYQLGTAEMSGIAILATDISERIQSEEKIRSLASELTRAEQEERQRISQVLHDDLQQRLFAIKAQLSFLKDLNLSADTYQELDQIQNSLSESIAISRNLSIDLSPAVLQGDGLAEAMTWLAFRVKDQYGLQVDLDVQDDFRHLDHHVRMLIFQSIRELLFNIVKHAGILEAKLTLEQVNGKGCITVSDNGKGFDSEAVLANPQMAHGLLILRDRLNLLGCHTKITSRPGQGTRIVIEIPVERMSV